LGSGLAFLKKQSNLIFASVDEFIMMLGQDEIKLSDIYYYAMDKAKINIGPSQEIDAFAYYLENNQTFYSDRIIHPSFMYYEVGLFHAFRAKYFKKMDKHLIKSSQRFIWVSHLNDFPDSIPIFIPSGISRMKDYLFLELKKCIVTFNVILNIDEDRRFFAAQVAKSLAIWLYIIESKNDVFLTDDLHIGIEIASEGEDPKMFMGYDGCFRLLLPDSFIQSSKMRDNMVEQQLMFILLESLAHFGVISGLNINQYIDKVFSECSGSFLLINKDGIPFLAENDGINSCYFINKRYCDVLLEEIADLINLKGEERKISISDSKNIVLKVLSFLNNKIIKLISSISTHDFLIRLLELHHAQLFWLQTTFSRFEQTNKLYEYLNANDFSQREYLQKYSETNILSQGIIEYLIIHCSKSKKKDAPIDKIEEVFAVMHHIYSFGLYCDLLSASLPNMELIILPNGRLALPKDKIDNFQEYFFDLRDSELYQPEELRTLEELLPEFSVDLDNKQFLSAFFSEYGIAYTSYLEIMNKSFEYANVKNQPIVSIKEEDFKSHIISSILSNDEYIFFKSNFILHSDLKSQIGKNKRFNESEQLIHRYNRRLQLSSRPWVNYNNMISFSSKSLYKSYQIFINRLESGKLNASSKEMISFLSQINALKGKQFNNHLYLLFKKFENTEMSIRKEEPIKPNKVLANDSDLGDIDILLINTVKKKIVCIEAKNYYEGRSAYEIISQAKTTEDNLSKVYRREEWCINNILKFSHIHNAVDESYSLTTVFLTYNQPAYIYFERNSSKIKFISALDIITSPMKIFDL